MTTTSSHDPRSGLRWNAWNLLLLIPLLWLITPLYNTASPALFGMPFFYWFLLAGIPVAAICTLVVYVKTNDRPGADDLDEGGQS
jgi:uncharacterized membrane protein